MRKGTACLSVILSLSCGVSAYARPVYDSAAPIAYLIDLSSGAVLYDKQSTKRIAPASMTKMLSAYVIFDKISKKQLRLDQNYSISAESWKKWQGVGSTMFLAPQKPVSISNLLHGMLTLSGNDAAISLAEGVAGTEAKFVDQMNGMAKNLGMKDSVFATANGWPDGGKTLTTARDLALLATLTIENHPLLYKDYYGQREFRWGNVTQPDRNPILDFIPGADGLKTGHTDDAGYCFTGSAEQNGRRLIMVVAGLPSFAARISESRKLMAWGFSAWESKPVYKPGAVIVHTRVKSGEENRVDLIAPYGFSVTMPKGETIGYTLKIHNPATITAPITKGQKLAELVAKLSDGSEQHVPLFAAQSVAKAGFLRNSWNGLKDMLGLA